MALGSILCTDSPETDDVHTNEPTERMDATTLGPRNIFTDANVGGNLGSMARTKAYSGSNYESL